MKTDFVIHCKFSEMRDVVNLQPHPQNPNKHSDRQIALLAKILRHQGWRAPIQVSSRSGYIVAGHGRLEAAKLGGLQSVPVDVQDFENEADELSHLLADNRIAELADLDMNEVKELIDGAFPDDFDMDLTGYDMLMDVAEITSGIDEVDAEIDNNDAEALAQKWKTARGQRWSCGEHFLMCGDSTSFDDVAALMGGDVADVCFTSPPYDQQRTYGEASEKIKDWGALMDGVFDVAPMSDRGQVLVNLGMIHKKGEVDYYWNNWIESMRKKGWLNVGMYVWDQGGGFPTKSSGRLGMSHEFVFHFGRKNVPALKCDAKKTEGVTILKQRNMGRDSSGCKQISSGNQCFSGKGKIPDSIARVPRGNPEQLDHPAVFPVGLPLHFIRAWTGNIYEPFSGSGTTMMASESVGRKCYSMEYDSKFVALSLQRYQDATGKEPELMK